MDTLQKCDVIRDKITEILDKWRFVEDIKSDCLLIALQKHRPQEEWFKKWVNEYNRFEIIRREDNQYFPIKENETITDLHVKNIDFIFRLLDCKYDHKHTPLVGYTKVLNTYKVLNYAAKLSK